MVCEERELRNSIWRGGDVLQCEMARGCRICGHVPNFSAAYMAIAGFIAIIHAIGTEGAMFCFDKPKRVFCCNEKCVESAYSRKKTSFIIAKRSPGGKGSGSNKR